MKKVSKKRSRILEALNRYPFGMNQAEICRHLNGKALNEDTLTNPCAKCLDYANPRKRERKYKGQIFKPTCKPRYRALRSLIGRMIKDGLLFWKREKRNDKFMTRGWDWFKIIYPMGA